MLLSSNELDMLILQHGKDGTSADSKYIWVKYAQDENGTGLTDDPTNAVYIGIAYNKTEKHESDNPNDYTWTRIKGNDGESAYTVILQNENITFSVSNQNNIALMDQSFDTSVVVFKGTDAVSNFTIGTVESKNGISVIQKNNTITFSVEAGNKIEADYGKFSIPISVNGLVFKKEVSWSLAKAGAVGGQGNPGEPALSISLGNESQNIPCTYDGHVINDMLIEISFVGYRGLTRTPCNVAVGTLPSGMTLGSTENCTISNDGSIILNIVKNATLGTELTLTGNIVLTFSINGKTLVKNFTWTKSKDGGLSYIYSIEPSSYVINKTYDGTLSPASITFNAYYQKDGSDRIPYHGLFTIEESTTGSDFKSTYLSSKNESSLTYTPTSNNIKSVRCTLSQTDKVSVVLDRQTVIVLSDDKMKDALTTVTTRVNGVSSKVDGIDKKITNKVWQTDITTAVNNYDGTTVKSLRDQVSSQETKIGEITSEVSDVKTTVKNNQASVQKDIASIKQDATGFKQTVASTYETKNDATSKYSSFDQRAGKIETNVKTLQGNVTTLSQTDTEIKAELKTAKGDITTLKSDASGLSTKITNAQGDVNILKADAKTMKSDISDAKGNISELQRTSTNLQSQITNNNTNINILSRDPMNYSQLKEDTADYFGFTYDNTADGKWYTVKTLSRDKFISGYYECMGGESFNIEFEISTSVKGNSTNEGTDSTYKGTAIGLYGFNAQKQSVGINYSARTTATAAATATKISSVVSVPVNSRYFRVFLQTESWGNFSGTLKIRNVIVSRIKAMETRISSAETAIQQNTNDISLRATNVQLDQVKKEINGNFANYSTTTEMNSAINQAANSITLDVSKKYTEKTVYDQGIADAKKDATTKADNALNSAKADATSKANKAESNAKADTANKLKNYSTTTEMNSAIKVKADSITQEVSKTYTKQTDFNSLYIGGRNLARNTSSSYSSEFSGFSGAANICPSVATVLTDGLAAGDEITIHLYYNYSNIVAATGQTAKVWIQGSGNVTGWSSGVFPSSPSIAISGSGTKEFLYTTTVSEDQIKNSYWLVNLRHDYVQSGTVRWKMFKVEKGNRHSEWSPAPEDTSAAITKVEQTATGIRADLSNTQGDISSLQATASGLQKSISNAQGDINTMKSDATKIKTRISNAEGDISTLQQTANGFQVQLSKKADQVDSFNWNLVPNSYKMNNQWGGAGGFVGTTTVVLDPDALCGYHIEVKCTTAGSGPHYPVFGKTSDKVGKTYTWSFWAKCSANKSSVPVGHECGGIKRIDLTTSWQKYFMTWKYIDAAYSSFTFYATFAVGEILYIRDFKIEEGSIATKWAPAESDLKGEKGDKGDKGATGAKGDTGKGVKSIVEQYYKSTSATAMSGGSWSTTYPGWENSKYIWTRSVITYTDNTTSTTTAVCVTGARGDKGATGGTGPTGNGIKSITEHYAVSTSNSSAPTTWSTTVPTMTETNKYLWNYETITYTNNTTNDTAKRVIGAYGNKGATGEDGKNGTNLWVNPLFESGKPQITRIDTSVTAPNGAAVNILDSRDHQNSSTAFPVFPGHQYRITVHRKRITGSLELNSGIWYITRTSGNAYDTIVVPTSTKDLGNSWQEATYNFTCPSGKSKGSVYFQIDQQRNNITTKWYIANVICVDITGLKGDTGVKGDKGDKGATGSAALQVKRNFSGTYTSVGQITTCGTNDFNRPPFAGDTFICLDGSSNTGTWLVTSVSGGTVNIKLLAYVNSKGATGSKGDKGEKGEKGEADIKCYPLTGGSNQLVWSKLGTLISAGDNSNFIINIYTGSGYNGQAQQNSQAEIVIKDGWQASASTTSAFGVSVTRQNCDDLKVQVRATASNKCDVWVYLPWAYSWGTYTIAGKYTSWETSSTTQTTEPITGTLQDLAYRMNSENAAKTATNFMEFTSGNGLQIGNKTDGSWSGYRTKISASAFEILNQAGITLAYYGDKLIQLGKNTKDSVIELCGGLGKIQSKQYSGYQACEMSSDYVALRSTHQAVLTSSTSTGNCMVSAAENTFGATATTTDSTGRTTKQGDIDISDGVVEFSSIRNGYDCTVGVYAGGWSGGTYRGSFSPSKGYTEKVLLGDNGAGQLWDRLMAKNATQIMSDRREKFDIKPLGPDVESQIATMSLDSEHSNVNSVDIHSELFDRLQPVQYKMVNDDQRIRFGFVAQDVVDAMKELGIREDELDLVHHDQRVTENGYNDTYGMVYTNLIALITHELQLEKQRRSNLELEVADLRSELETMRDNLSGNTN
jgi:peptidoglycan hydrolase CwlO-like protein